MESLEKQIGNILDEDLRDLQQATKESAKAAAEFSKNYLKANSPRRVRRGGKYARAWAVKRVENGLLTSYVVYNSRYPGLTMNLEYGHAVSNQYGATGKRAAAVTHIKPAEELGIAEFEKEIERRYGRG